MLQEDINQLKAIFTEVLNERQTIDSETHRKDHEFIHMMIDRQEKRAELIESTKKQVLGWAMVGTLGLIGFSILEHLKIFLIKILN